MWGNRVVHYSPKIGKGYVSAFKGSYEYSIDNKGRINIPAKLKKYVSPEANDAFVATRGFEQCVYVYPQDEWNRYEQKLRALSPTEPKDRFFIRMLLQSAVDSQLDAQSRITIPKELLKHADIAGEVIILGALDHIEVWNPDVYNKYLADQKESYEDVAKTFLSKG